MSPDPNPDRWIAVGPGASEASEAASAGEWRWRSYTEHLDDLGYEMDGSPVDGGPEADELAQAVAEYRRRARPSSG